MLKFRHGLKVLRSLTAIVLFATGCSAGKPYVGSKTGREALEKTSAVIRDAFNRGDVATILAYHHPDVLKGLTYGRSINGRNALEADLTGTLQRFNLNCQENRVESTLIQGDTAVELTSFTIKGIPKAGGDPFLFNGRAMVVYVCYRNSPTDRLGIHPRTNPTLHPMKRSSRTSVEPYTLFTLGARCTPFPNDRPVRESPRRFQSKVTGHQLLVLPYRCAITRKVPESRLLRLGNGPGNISAPGGV